MYFKEIYIFIEEYGEKKKIEIYYSLLIINEYMF